MSLDSRNTSALFKRAEQLRRWEESEMNRQPIVPKNSNNRRIKFSSGCIFLAACVSGDKDEVSRLLDNGADIDTANVDGLTALHQACIDDNLDMVEYLVAKGADVNRKDNEGWTPLHATSSCGFLSIARYLIESGADLAAINSDGELALDLASSDAMEDLIRKHVEDQGIDCEEARTMEETMMLSDAKKWLRNENSDVEKPHPKTGATALHVASAKGYHKVLKILLDGRADVDRQDIDGWTPLHAAAYWGQLEAAQMLIDSQADLDVTNYSGQTAIDIAQKDIVMFLQEARSNYIKRPKRRPASQPRITDTIENNIETPPKVIRVDIKPVEIKEEVPEKENQPTESDVILRRTQSFESDEKFYQKYQELRARIKANSCPVLPAPLSVGVVGSVNNNKTTPNNFIVQRSASLKDHRQLRKTTTSLTVTTPTITTTTTQTTSSPPTSPASTPTSTPSSGQIRRSFVPPTRDEESETQRKAHAKRVRETRRSTQGVTLDEIKSAEQLVKRSNSNNETTTTTPATINDRVPSINAIPDSSEPISASFTIAAPKSKTDDQKEADDGDKVCASYVITNPGTVSSVTVNASLPHTSESIPKDKDKEKEKDESNDVSVSATITAIENVPTNNNNNNTISNNLNKKTDSEELTKSRTPSFVNNNKIGIDIDDTTTKPNLFTKRFDIDSSSSLTLAEKLRQEANKYADNKDTSKCDINDYDSTVLLRKESIGSNPASPLHQQLSSSERRPSWRLKVDAGSKFKLEDASSPNSVSSSTQNDVSVTINKPSLSSLAQRRQNGDSNATRPVSAPVLSIDPNDRVKDTSANSPSTPTEIAAPLRRLKSSEDNKENDKENDNRSAQATQAVIQRRRRPKRRSTGVVHVDLDDIDPDRQDFNDTEEKESGSERSRSRLNSSTSAATELPDHNNDSKENGSDFIDYKALYEATKADYDKLKLNFKKKDEEVVNLKAALDRFANATKNSLSELEKREKRAMERKMSEMEEELKQLQKYKTENERLRAENRALTRVVSKLTTSAQNQLHNKQ